MKKVISILLALVMAFSLAVPAFAAGETVPQYENYLCFGDSVAAGCSNDGYNWRSHSFVHDTYPALVKEAVGAKTVAEGGYSYNGAHSGMRTREALVALLGKEYANDFTYNWFDTNNYGGAGCVDYILGEKYMQYLENADLITVNFGSNDIVGTLIYQIVVVMSELSKEGKYAHAFDDAIAAAESMEARDALITLLNALQSTVTTAEEIAKVMEQLAYVVKTNGVSDFIGNWDVLMDTILVNAKDDVDIVVIGVYNPVYSMLGVTAESVKESENGTLYSALNDIAQMMIDTVNNHMQYGSAYRGSYNYVDVSFVADELAAGNHAKGDTVHPDHHTHGLIAEEVIKTIRGFCRHQHTVRLFEKKATLFEKGYTGDLVCSDCGALIEQGAVINILGKTTEIPKGIGYAAATGVLNTATKVVTGLLGKLTKK